MSQETSKARLRRIHEGYFTTIFQGRGIDIGCGYDPVTPTCVGWDKLQGDAHELAGLEPASFDWVYSSHCLEYLEDPRRALKRWWEILKPGGKILVVIPDEDLYEQGHWPSRYNCEHMHTFTVHKTASWSPVSINLTDLLSELPYHKVKWIRTCDYNYDYSGGTWDRTQGDAEAHIELLVEKAFGPDSPKRRVTAAQMLQERRNQTDDKTLGLIYLDTVLPLEQQLHYGALGLQGDLGYEGRRVVVQSRGCEHALSAHAPSRVVFDLEGEFSLFCCQVVLNDDVANQDVWANFCVVGDGRTLAEALEVKAGALPVEISANVAGVHMLELRASTSTAHYCHSVWTFPYVQRSNPSSNKIEDRTDDATGCMATRLIRPQSAVLPAKHKLVVHGNLGDHAAYTGVAFGYWKKFEEKLLVWTDRREFHCLWENNPYCELSDLNAERTYSVRFEALGDVDDWKMYRPQRILLEMTGTLADQEDVNPNLYYSHNPVSRRVVVCDQASWASRRGYPYLNNLLQLLRIHGWEVIYLRNNEMSERQVYCEDYLLRLNLPQTIEVLATASLFIGYDSGLAHVAAGLNVPSIILAAATPATVFRHRSCFFCAEACNPCCRSDCNSACLSKVANQNAAILEAISTINDDKLAN